MNKILQTRVISVAITLKLMCIICTFIKFLILACDINLIIMTNKGSGARAEARSQDGSYYYCALILF